MNRAIDEQWADLDRSNILHAIRDVGRSNDFSTDKESVTMTRLHEHKVKKGVEREEHFSSNQKRIVNQHRTGVVSHFPLRDILHGDQSTYGLKSLMCNEDDLSNNNNGTMLQSSGNAAILNKVGVISVNKRIVVYPRVRLISFHRNS
jgi:hypothetical protein